MGRIPSAPTRMEILPSVCTIWLVTGPNGSPRAVSTPKWAWLWEAPGRAPSRPSCASGRGLSSSRALAIPGSAYAACIPLRCGRWATVCELSTCGVLSIGAELTRGEIVNSNAAWLGAELTAIGFEVVEHAVVDDNQDRIREALGRLAARARVIVSTGGLGPTTDDVTTQAVATALGVRLVRDDASLDHIRRRFERFGRTMGLSNAKQADFPE